MRSPILHHYNLNIVTMHAPLKSIPFALIDDEMMVIGFCFSCDDIAMLPLHDMRNSSTMPCDDHIVPNMHCFGCCEYSPCDVSTISHDETPIVSSYILGDLDASILCMSPMIACTFCIP